MESRNKVFFDDEDETKSETNTEAMFFNHINEIMTKQSSQK